MQNVVFLDASASSCYCFFVVVSVGVSVGDVVSLLLLLLCFDFFMFVFAFAFSLITLAFLRSSLGMSARVAAIDGTCGNLTVFLRRNDSYETKTVWYTYARLVD